ncbi:MAG TPA: SurA N-terminal domain-containing protein [Blastocatellia bacterium]|nr:SurA N-terminal domain-containing protein [Blastocatellia bacterium]
MLKFLRGRKRTRNAVLVIFIGLLTLSLVALFSASGSGAKMFGGAVGSDTAIARVGSYEVTAQDLKAALTNFGQQISQGQGRQAKQDLSTLYDMYGPQVLDGLIRQKLILYQAERLNLGASDSEVQSRLRQMFNPWPGAEAYRLRLQQYQPGMTPVRFEDELRGSIAQEHLRSFITAAVSVDPKEVEEDYRRNNSSYEVRWVDVDPNALRDKVQVNEQDLRAYFDGHKGDFKITTEQRRASYIFVDQSKAGEAIQISDDELKQDFNAESFIKQVRASQIVINAPKPEANEKKDKSAPEEKKAVDPEEEIRKKAQGITQRAQTSEGKPGEDFAKLAREFSEDAKTKASGGDLGWISKDAKREADDPLNRIFNMKKDEVSQPIKKGDKYYILKVTDRKIPTFADARDELLKAARSRKAYSKAENIATEAEQKLKESKNAEAVAAEINHQYGAQVAAVKDTGFFAKGDTLPDLGAASELESSIFELQNTGDVGDWMPIDKGFAVPQYAERRDPHEPAFEEVKTKVETAYRAEKSKELAAQRAKELAKAQNAEELKKLADSMGLKTDERAGLKATESIGVLVSEFERAPVYKLNVGEVTREPIKTDNDVFVVAALKGRKDADMGEPFQKERASIEQRLLDEKRNTFFSTYLAMTQKQMTDEGKIKLYDDAIATALETGGAPSQTGQPQLPTRSGGSPRRTPQGPQGNPRTLPGKR